MKITIILPATFIPTGEEVAKVNGGKPYILRRQLSFYGELKASTQESRLMTASEGTAFLCSSTGDVTVIRDDLLLSWTVQLTELIGILQKKQQELEDQRRK